VGSDVVTLTGGDNEKTVGMPGTSSKAITVGSYITRFTWPAWDGGQYSFSGATDRVGDYSFFSSVGPTADGRQKPDISAPGEAIVSALSSAVNMAGNEAMMSPDGKHQVLQGTSMAAPHVTGATALLLGINPPFTADQIKTLLTTTAISDAFATGLPNVIWGFGKMDVPTAMARALNSGTTVRRSVIAYDEPGDGYYWQLTGPTAYALRFSPPASGKLAEVQVKVMEQDVRPIVGGGSLVCEVHADAGGSPGSRIGNPVQIPLAMLNPGTNNSVSLLSANADVDAGTDYFVVLSLSQPSDTLAVLSDVSSSGNRSLSYNGSNWTAIAQNFRFRPVVASLAGATSTGERSDRPFAFDLQQNFPNPFNPSTQIHYSIPSKGHVSLKVFDLLGKEVATIIDGDENAGSHQVLWKGTNSAGRAVSSGVYFYRLQSGGLIKTQKMILMK
jgi:hypothetical protein